MRCIVREMALAGEPYLGVDVVDSGDFVTYEATYFPTLESLAQMNITVRLVA
jgi:hypothetical protein